MPVELPLDVIECVFEFLREDKLVGKRVLACCSLMSRDLARISRHYLFHSITLPLAGTIAPDSSNAVSDRYDVFSRESQLAHHVKELSLLGDPFKRYGVVFCIHQPLAKLLAVFPNLETLVIGRVNIMCSCENPSSQGLPPRYQLKNLTVFAKIHSIPHLFGLLTLFQRIEVLELLPHSQLLLSSNEETYPLSMIPAGLEIGSVTVHHPLELTIFRALHHTSTTAALHTVRPSFMSPEATEEFLRVIDTCTSIRQLDLEMEVFISDNYHGKRLHLVLVHSLTVSVRDDKTNRLGTLRRAAFALFPPQYLAMPPHVRAPAY